MQFAWGYTAPLMIEAAIRHKVFDLLSDRPRTVEEVSKESGASVRGLRAIMNALVGLDTQTHPRARVFWLAPVRDSRVACSSM
jgi:hypothetical protein